MSTRGTVLVTGGAGFVGSSIALALKRDFAERRVVALDNLRRRGSELALERLRAGGVEFVHGDVRCRDDLMVGEIAAIVDCAAEPSVHAGQDGSPDYVLATNLGGTINCLEAARRSGADFFLLSTSRVYAIGALRGLPLEDAGERLALHDGSAGPGWSASGIDHGFATGGFRSIYGASKLASEIVAAEYAAAYGLRVVINRCGVIAGPWQMGKVDQGFIVLWAARHLFGGSLSYVGFGGDGRQVRDVLHVDDLVELIAWQMANVEKCSGRVLNIGGGPANATSLRELTAACARRAGRQVTIGSVAATSPVDVPWYVTDLRPAAAAYGWQPRRTLETILDDVFGWLGRERHQLAPILG